MATLKANGTEVLRYVGEWETTDPDARYVHRARHTYVYTKKLRKDGNYALTVLHKVDFDHGTYKQTGGYSIVGRKVVPPVELAARIERSRKVWADKVEKGIYKEVVA